MSVYQNEIEKMRWSYSRLTCFEHCPYEFYLQYIVSDDDEYLSEGNYYAEVGTYVHDILEMIFNNELSVEDAPQYFADYYDDNVLYTTKKSTMDKTYEACANYLADFSLDILKDYEILGVELECKFQIAGYDFIGYIDLLLKDKNDGKIVVVDHKSAQYPLKKDGGVKKSSEESFITYKRQMYLYSYAVNDLYGEFPKEIKWNHFKENKVVTIPFDEEEYKEAVEWFVDTIKRIEAEEDFEPNEQYFYCHNLCNYRHSCEYLERN